jgi:hypothetical protein
MRKLVRPATFLGGFVCGVALTVLVIGRFSVQARQAPAGESLPVPQIAASVEPVQEPPQNLPSPKPPASGLEDLPSIAPPPPVQKLDPSPTAAPAAEPEVDPESLAGRYVEKTKQEAKNAVERLTKEAETLKARLKKVDAALVRWRGLLNALDAPGAPPQGAVEVPEPGLSIRAAEPGAALPAAGPEAPKSALPPPELPRDKN